MLFMIAGLTTVLETSLIALKSTQENTGNSVILKV